MSRTGKTRTMREQDKINFAKGKDTQFTSNNQPKRENKQKGLDTYWQTQRLLKNLKMVCCQTFDKIKANEQTEKLKEQVKKLFPDIEEKEIDYTLSIFVNCLLDVNKTKDFRQLKTALEIAGIIQPKPQVEVSINNNVASTKIDKDSLKALMEIMADKKKK